MEAVGGSGAGGVTSRVQAMRKEGSLQMFVFFSSLMVLNPPCPVKQTALLMDCGCGRKQYFPAIVGTVYQPVTKDRRNTT